MTTPKEQPEYGSCEAVQSNSIVELEVEQCQCGHDRNHYMVSAVPTYTAWGTLWITLMGVSATPIRIDFKCRVCGEVFDFIRNSKELKKFL